MKKLIIRYRFALLALLGLGVLVIFNREMGTSAVELSAYTVKEMLLILPPIFILLGLLDVWVPREMMIAYMGEDSGLKGTVLSFVIGSAAAGPLYGAFPVAAVFLRKGASLFHVLIFIGAWSTTKIPMLLFEFTSLGWRFALVRLLINLPVIYLMAFLLTRILGDRESGEILERAEKMAR